jgi:hypothetical protein
VSFRRVVFGESILTNRPPPPLQPSTIAGTPSADTFSPKAKLNADSRIILIRVKIERAKKNLVELEKVLRSRYGPRYMKAFITDEDPKTGKPMPPTLQTIRVLPFDSLSIAGDIIQNLRSALDHLAYQLVLANGASPTRDTFFPIGKDRAAYERMKAGCVKGMRADAKKAIDRVKPYGGGNDALWSLHMLNIMDKHRLLFTVGTNFSFRADWINHPLGFNEYRVNASNPDFGGIFDRKTEDKIQLKITKPLSQAQIIKSDPLLPTLHQLVNVVEGLVFSFKPQLQ